MKLFLLLIILIFSTSGAFTQIFEWKWVRAANSSDVSTGLAIDYSPDSSSVYIGGRSEGGAFRILGFSAGSSGTDGYVGKYNKNGTYQWLFGIESNGWDEVTAIDVDASNNVYVGGAFQQTADFKGYTLGSSVLKTSNGGTDIFIAKYNSSGILQWVETFGSTSDDYVRDIQVVGGSVYVAGEYGGAMSIGSTTITPTNNLDAYGLSISAANGSFNWLVGAGSNANDGYNTVTVFGGFAYFGGYFSGNSMAFNGTAILSSNNAQNGQNEGVLAKYNAATGAFITYSLITGNGDDRVIDMTNDGSKIYYVGTFEKLTTFPGWAAINEPHNEMFVARCSNVFTTEWLRTSITSGSSVASSNSIDIDAAGHLAMVGHFKGTTAFLGDNYVSNGDEDILMAWIDPTTGNGYDGHSYGGTGRDVANTLSVNSTDRVYMTGSFNNTVVFTPISRTATSNDNTFWGAAGCIQGTAAISGTTTICQNDIASLTFTFTGPAPYSFTYYDGTISTTVTSITSTTHTINVSPTSTKTYTITDFAANSCVSMFSGSATITVLPSIINNTIPTASQTICSGSSPGTLLGSDPAGGNGTFTYQWQRKSLIASTWTNATFGTPTGKNYNPENLTQNTVFRRRVLSSTCDTSYSNIDTIFVQTAITGNNLSDDHESICITETPDNIVATSPSGGSGVYTYQWMSSTVASPAWVPGGGATQNSASYSPGIRTVTTYFRRVVTGSVCGTNTSPTFTLKVDQLITNNTISGSNPRCYPSESVLDGTLPSGGDGSFNYFWQFSADGITYNSILPNILTQDYPVLNAYPVVYWYRRRVSSGECPSTFSNSILVDVPITNNSISSNQIICSDDLPNQLTGPAPTTNASPITYLWESSTNGTTWSSVTGTPSSTQNLLPSSLTNSLYYRRKVTSPACGVTISNTVQIEVHNPIGSNSILSPNQTVCSTSLPDSLIGLQPANGSGTYSYQWQVNVPPSLSWGSATGLSTGKNYSPSILSSTTNFRRRVVSDPCDTSYSDVVSINVIHPIDSNFILTKLQTICSTESPSTLIGSSNVTGGYLPYQYQWFTSTNTNPTWINAVGLPNNGVNYSPTSLAETTYFMRIVMDTVCGNSVSNIDTIIVHLPIANNTLISANQTICSGSVANTILGSLPTGGAGSYIYIWQNKLVGALTWTTIPSSNSINYSPGVLTNSSVFRRLVVAGVCDTSVSNIDTIFVQEPITNNNLIGSQQQICITSLPSTIVGTTPSGGLQPYSIQWFKNTSSNPAWVAASGSSADSIEYVPGYLSETSNFRRVISGGVCPLSTSSIFTIKVDSLIDSNEILGSPVRCYPLNTVFNATQPVGGIEGGSTYNYSWQWRTTSTSFANFSPAQSNLNLTLVSPITEVHWYRRVVTSGLCPASYSDSVKVDVQINNNQVGLGQLICSVDQANILTGPLPTTNASPITYLWEKSTNGTAWTNATGNINTNFDFQPPFLDSTTYYRRKIGTDGCGINTSDSILIIVHQPILDNTIDSIHQTLCSGSEADTIFGSVPSGGAGAFTYIWQKKLVGATSWITVTTGPLGFYTPGVLSASTVFRRLVAAGVCDTSVSNIDTIFVQEPIANNTILSSNQYICSTNAPDLIEAEVVFGGNGTNNAIWQVAELTGTWVNGAGVTTNTSYLPGLLTESIVIRRIIEDNICGNDTSNVDTIFVDSPIALNVISSDTILCASTPTHIIQGLVFGTSSFTFVWERTADTSNVANWTVISGASNSVYTIINPMDTMYYRRTIDGGFCPDLVSNVTEIIVALPIGNNTIFGDTTVCFDSNPILLLGSNITGGIGGNTIIWESSLDGIVFDTADLINDQINYLSDTITESYYYHRRVVNAACPSQDSISNMLFVDVNSLSMASFVGDKDSLCFGETINIALVLNGVSPFTLYMDYGSTSANLTGISDSIFNYEPSASNSFYLDSIKDANGCVYNLNDTFELRVVDQPNTHLFDDQRICDSILSINPQLSFGQGSLISPTLGNFPTTFPVDIIAPSYGAHDLIFTEINEFCTSADTMTILFYRPIDTVNAGPDQTLAEEFETQLSATPLIGTELGVWSIASGSGTFTEPNSPDSKVEYLQDKFNYLVWTVSNGVCPMKRDTVRIESRLLFIPSGFSPNGDGVNDVYIIDGAWNSPFVKLQVFNRWGNLVYSSENYKNDWAGKAKSGEDLPDDTYYYIVDVSENEMYKGFLIIKR